MTKFDEEFEKWWNDNGKKGPAIIEDFGKRMAYDGWQAAKTTPQQPDVKNLALKGGDWYINGAAEVSKCETSENTAKAGRERKNQASAEAAARKMIKRDVLHAHATEHSGEEYVWEYGKTNRYLYLDRDDNRWKVGCDRFLESVGTVYMADTTAEFLRDALNDGRLEL